MDSFFSNKIVVCLATPASPFSTRLSKCLVFVPPNPLSGQELFRQSSFANCETVSPSLICRKKLLSPWSCFPVRQLLFLQIYHALRALILQKKYQKKYKKYTVKFLLLAVALHQLLRARCGHSIKTLHQTVLRFFAWPQRGFDQNQVELEAERAELFFRIRRMRFLSFRSCQRLNKKGYTTNFGIAIPRSLLTFKQQEQDDFLKILSGQKSISLPLILC